MKLRPAEFRSLSWVTASGLKAKHTWCQNHLPVASNTLCTDSQACVGDSSPNSEIPLFSL